MGSQRRRRDVRVGFIVVICLLLLGAIGRVAAGPARAALAPPNPTFRLGRIESGSGVAELNIDFVSPYDAATVLLFFLPDDIEITAATPEDPEFEVTILEQEQDPAAWQSLQDRVGAQATLDYAVELPAPLQASFIDRLTLTVTLQVSATPASGAIQYLLLDQVAAEGETPPDPVQVGDLNMAAIRRAAPEEAEATATPEAPEGLGVFPVTDIAGFVSLRLEPLATGGSRTELGVTFDRQEYGESVLLFLFYPAGQLTTESDLDRLAEPQRTEWGALIATEQGLAEPLGDAFRVPSTAASAAIGLDVAATFSAAVDNVLSVVLATDPPVAPPTLPAVSEPLPVPESATILTQAGANAATATAEALATATTAATATTPPPTATTGAAAPGAAEATAQAQATATARAQGEEEGGIFGRNTTLIVVLLLLIVVFAAILIVIIMRLLRPPQAVPAAPAPVVEARPTARLGPSLAPVGGGAEIKIENTPFTIGRAADNDLVIDERFAQAVTVSRHHAVIRRQNGEFVIVDRDSQNGIRVNGRPTAKNLLRDGWHVTIGGVEFVFHSGTPSNQQQQGGLSS